MKEIKKDVNTTLVLAIVVVCVIAISAAASDLYGYAASFAKPSLALLNQYGLAQNYPARLVNASTIRLVVYVHIPQGPTSGYALEVFLSNGTGFTSEVRGPVGKALLTLPLPAGKNVTLPLNLTVYYRSFGSSPLVYLVVVNGYAVNTDVSLVHGLAGFFFELVALNASGYTPLSEWVNLWLTVNVA